MASIRKTMNEADLVPGSFPSEGAVVDTEQNTPNSQIDNATLATSTKATSSGTMDEKSREFLEQQKAAHTAGGQKTDKYIPEIGEDGGRSGTTQREAVSPAPTQVGSGPGQNSEAWTDVARPETLLQNSGAGGNASAGSQRAETSSAGHDESTTIGSDLATMATAVGLAAKDALSAVTDAAGPAASAATEQAKNLAGYAQENAAPAANYAAEQAGNAVAYTRDTVASSGSIDSREPVHTEGVLQTAGSAATYAKDTAYSAANTAQSYAPNVLGEPSTTDSTARDIAPEVPRTVQESVTQAGKSPEAATNSQAVEDKAQMERELLGQRQSQEEEKPPVNLTSGVKGLEEQLAPESMTPGVVTVLGTEQDRSFPLGATDPSVST